MPDITISDAEWIVMRVIWRLGKATAAEAIAELAPSEKWSHRTIRTLLGRLVEKGVITAEELRQGWSAVEIRASSTDDGRPR